MTCYVKSISTLQLREDEAIEATVDGRPILLALVQGRVHAFDAMCTHGAAELIDGCIDGFEISCPLHDGRFDIRDGRPTCAPATAPLRCYPVRVEGEHVYVSLAAQDITPR